MRCTLQHIDRAPASHPQVPSDPTTGSRRTLVVCAVDARDAFVQPALRFAGLGAQVGGAAERAQHARQVLQLLARLRWARMQRGVVGWQPDRGLKGCLSQTALQAAPP